MHVPVPVYLIRPAQLAGFGQVVRTSQQRNQILFLCTSVTSGHGGHLLCIAIYNRAARMRQLGLSNMLSSRKCFISISQFQSEDFLDYTVLYQYFIFLQSHEAYLFRRQILRQFYDNLT